MSITHIQPVYEARKRIDYFRLGVGDTRTMHLLQDTDRMTGFTTSLGSPSEFIQHAEAHGRRVQMYSITQSWSKSEMDVNNPDDVRMANTLGWLLAREAFPHSDVLVVTHTDSKGGCLHNHIAVMNKDLRNGKAITSTEFKKNTLHRNLSAINDKLMKESGLEVYEPTLGRKVTQAQYWDEKRNEFGEKSFDVLLGDAIERNLARVDSVDWDSFRRNLEADGVSVEITSHKTREGEMQGVTYKMLDTTGSKQRMRRRKASKLSTEFTMSGVEERFKLNMIEQEKARNLVESEEVYEELFTGVEETKGSRLLQMIEDGNKQYDELLKSLDTRMSLGYGSSKKPEGVKKPVEKPVERPVEPVQPVTALQHDLRREAEEKALRDQQEAEEMFRITEQELAEQERRERIAQSVKLGSPINPVVSQAEDQARTREDQQKASQPTRSKAAARIIAEAKAEAELAKYTTEQKGDSYEYGY